LAARRIAADVLDGVLRRRRPLDEQLSDQLLAPIDERDRALVRRLAATVLRRLGTLRHLLGTALDRGFPADAPRVETILLIGTAQLFWLDVPDHAAVDLAVRLAHADPPAARYPGLVNAVLRRLARDARRPPRGPRGPRSARRPRHGGARHPRVAAGALEACLWGSNRAGDRRSARRGAAARCHGEARSANVGDAAARTRGRNWHCTPRRPRARVAAAGLC